MLPFQLSATDTCMKVTFFYYTIIKLLMCYTSESVCYYAIINLLIQGVHAISYYAIITDYYYCAIIATVLLFSY